MSERPHPSLADQVVDRGARLVSVALGTVLGGIAMGRETVRSTPPAALPGVVLDGARSLAAKARDEAAGLAFKGLATVSRLRGGDDEPTPYPEPTPVASRPSPVPSAAPEPTVTVAPEPEPEPEPAAVEPSPVLSEEAGAAVTAATEGVAEPTREELPLADYDHLTLGSLRARLRSLTVDDLAALRAYEVAHADRLPVVAMFDNRIAKLSAT